MLILIEHYKLCFMARVKSQIEHNVHDVGHDNIKLMVELWEMEAQIAVLS